MMCKKIDVQNSCNYVVDVYRQGKASLIAYRCLHPIDVYTLFFRERQRPVHCNLASALSYIGM